MPHPDTGEVDRKRRLREATRATRRDRAQAVDAAQTRERHAEAVTAAFTAAYTPAPGQCVAAFRAWRTEPPTAALIESLLARGVRVLVPHTREDLDLDWRAATPGGGAGDLLGTAAVADADVLLIPALRVDTTGGRLGQGGGCYDRVLPRRRSETPAVALVFDDEVDTQPLPREPHDLPVDAVITPDAGHRRVGP